MQSFYEFAWAGGLWGKLLYVRTLLVRKYHFIMGEASKNLLR